MNVTLDDASPQFQWYSQSSTWLIDHKGDPATSQYFKGTFHGTFNDGDSMQLKFKGSAVYVYGAMRGNHGLYSAQLDGGNLVYQLGYSEEPKIQALLFSQGGLDPKNEHTVTLVNLPSQTTPPGNDTVQWWFDIDYAVVTIPVDEKVYTTIYDDTSTWVQYSGSGWASNPPLQPETYYNTTAHIASKQGDAFSLQFNGSSVQIFGGLYTDHGNYTVSLDGQPQGNYNGSWVDLAPATSLFFASGLTDGPHEIMVTNIGQGPRGSFFDFDYAVVNSTTDPSTIVSGTSTGTNTTDIDPNGAMGQDSSAKDESSGPNVAAIGGGVGGGVGALILLGLLVWWFLRKRRNGDGDRDSLRRPRVDLTGEEVKPYDQPGSAATYPHSVGYTDSTFSGAPYSDMRHASQPFLSAVPPPPASNATSYPHSINPPSSVGIPETIEEHTNPLGSNGNASRHTYTALPGISSVGSNSTGAASSASSTAISHGPTKALGVVLPFTARRTMSDDSSLLGTPVSRMQRTGREVDMGPLPMHEEEEDEVRGSLPPDYQQATEPLPGQRPY